MLSFAEGYVGCGPSGTRVSSELGTGVVSAAKQGVVADRSPAATEGLNC